MDKSEIEYGSIKEDVMFGYDEYMDNEYFSVYEATDKIIEEDCRIMNYNEYTRACYLLSIAIETVKMGEIETWIYEKTEKYVINRLEDFSEKEETLYKQDLEILKKLLANSNYKVIETSDIDKAVFHDILYSFKSDLLYLKLIYKAGNAVEQETIRKYSTILPGELMQIWEKYGFGSLIEGYLRIINPDDYQELLNDTYFRGKISIPILITAFGDIVTYEEGGYIGIVKYKDGSSSVISRHFKKFMSNLTEKAFTDKYLEISQYAEAIDKLGVLGQDECFGYIPISGLDGSEKTQNLKKIKTREYIEIIKNYSVSGM